MATISLCMILKNEEKVLARCLDSVSDLVDEIIIVDTGSTDHTKEIAANYTSHIYSFPWCDDFSAARNYSFSKASMDYCMWMDADDILNNSEHENFLHLKQTLNPDTDFVMMKYQTSFDEADNPLFSYFRERWIKNNRQYLWIGEVHEVIPPCGNILYSDIAISHKKESAGDPDRNLRIYSKMISQGKTLDPRHQYYYARELYYHQRYEEAIAAFEEFLKSPNGWIENKIEACSICARCYYHLKQDDKALQTLLLSLSFDTPRSEICCDIGKHFLEHENYTSAIYWYETASTTKRNDRAGGFILPDCYDYIPFLQLCVCYHKIGDYKKAEEYNEKAGICKPYSKSYLYNKNYFEHQ